MQRLSDAAKARGFKWKEYIVSFQILNIETIRHAVLQQQPYPYMIIENVIRPESLAKAVESFPSLSKRGSFPLNAVSCSGHFDLLMKELQQPELRRMIAERFEMDLEDKPPMITVRGYTTNRDGHIHVDSEDKLITLLLYLSPGWTSPDGKIRVLYNRRDLAPFAAELSPEAGHCLIFKVTRDCWHGHTVFEGERKSIQLNYVASANARKRHLKRHTFSALLKQLFGRNETRSPY
jgi:SM-20-related protein